MTLHIYQDNSSEWRWRLVSRNGQIEGSCEEGHKRRAYVKKKCRKLFPHLEPVIDKPTPAGGFRGRL